MSSRPTSQNQRDGIITLFINKIYEDIACKTPFDKITNDVVEFKQTIGSLITLMDLEEKNNLIERVNNLIAVFGTHKQIKKEYNFLINLGQINMIIIRNIESM